MHISEGFLPLTHAAGWTCASAPFLVHAISKLNSLRDRRYLLAASAGYLFTLTALKLPSVAGSSSHPTGVALGTVLTNPCAGVEFPVRIKGLFRPHYMTWSEQQQIEAKAPAYLRNVIRIITETGLRVYKELACMNKSQVDLNNRVVWIPDSKTPNGVAEVPLTDLAAEAFRDQIEVSGPGDWLFPSERRDGHQGSFKAVWRRTLRSAGVPYFGSTMCARPSPRASARVASPTSG